MDGGIDGGILFNIVVALGLLGGLGAGVKAVLDRIALRAKANVDNASATEVVTRAARELIDPLRKELAAERAEHAEELAEQRKEKEALRKYHADQVEEERRAALAIKRQLEDVQSRCEAVTAEVETLRKALRETQEEADNWRQKYEAEKAKNT